MWIADWADLSFSGGTYPSPGCRSPGQVRVGLSTSSQRLQSQVLWAPHGRRGPCSLEMSPGAAGTAWRPGGSQPRAGAPNKLLPNLLRPNSGLAPPRKWAEPTCPAPRQVRTNSFHPCCLHLPPRHLLSTPPPPTDRSGWVFAHLLLSTHSDLHRLLGSRDNICFGKESNVYSLIYSGEWFSNSRALTTPLFPRFGLCLGSVARRRAFPSQSGSLAPRAHLRVGVLLGLQRRLRGGGNHQGGPRQGLQVEPAPIPWTFLSSSG